MTKRDKLKQDLLFLGLFGGKHLHTFRLMYSHEDMNAPINEIVNNMNSHQVSWAVTQVQNSLKKLQKQ